MSGWITEPGTYTLTAEQYHDDPVSGGSLSSTGARSLLAPSCPAKYRWRQDHPQHKRVFDVGHAAHTLVLGVGAPFAVIDAADYKTAAAREARDEAYAAGKTPLLEREHDAVQAMAAAVLEHPTAGALLEKGRGHREQVLVWRDQPTGVMCRAMLDAHDEFTGVGPLIIDVKTTVSAEPEAIAKSVEKFGYHQQDPFYSDGYAAVFGVEPAFVFVFVEKDPPHLVTVHQLAPTDRHRGRERNRRALEVYRQCVATGRWPGYSDQIVLNEAPTWAVIQHEMQVEAWRRADLEAVQTGDAA